MKLFYVVKHRIAEYAFMGRGLFAALIVTILLSTLFVTFLYGLAVETVFLPQSSDRSYREIKFFRCREAMKGVDEVYELLELCKAFGNTDSISFNERSSYTKSDPIDENGYEISGRSNMSFFTEGAYFRKGRVFFEESEYTNADEICVILSRKVQFETGATKKFLPEYQSKSLQIIK